MVSRDPGPQRTPASKYAVIAGEQPVVDQGDANDAKWIAAGGDPRDRGRFVELVSGSLTGSGRMMVGLAWFEPGDIHLLHHHPYADEWYYVIGGSALFTVGDEVIRGTPGTALFIPAGTGHRIENDGGDVLHIAWGFDRPELNEAGIIWDE
jgi:quercetin dioxygenase-like cupin family protein